jgi:hypothetical protein
MRRAARLVGFNPGLSAGIRASSQAHWRAAMRSLEFAPTQQEPRCTTQENDMIERIFTPLLAFTLLVGGTVAVGSELFRVPHATADATAVATVRLPRVEITGHRAAAADVATATLPRVEITGRRAAAQVATATLPRVEITGRRVATTVQLAEGAREQDCTTEEAVASGAPAAHI